MSRDKPFPLVRSAALSRPPSKSDIISAISICSTADGAEYLHRRVSDLYERSREVNPEAAAQLLLILETNYKNKQSIASGTGMVWEGRDFGSDFELVQRQVALDALKSLKAQSMSVDCKIAISPDSEIVRSYANNGRGLDESKVSALDNLLNAFLSEHHMLTKDGVVYEKAKGNIKLINGEPVRANVNDIKNALLDPTKAAFAAYVKSHAKSVDFKVTEAEYPAKLKEATPVQSQ
jgi:hypothetical protein